MLSPDRATISTPHASPALSTPCSSPLALRRKTHRRSATAGQLLSLLPSDTRDLPIRLAATPSPLPTPPSEVQQCSEPNAATHPKQSSWYRRNDVLADDGLLSTGNDRNEIIVKQRKQIHLFDAQLFKQEQEVAKLRARVKTTQDLHDKVFNLKEEISEHALFLECELQDKVALQYDLELDLQAKMRINDLLVAENTQLKATIAGLNTSLIDNVEKDRLRAKIKALQGGAKVSSDQQANMTRISALQRQLALRDKLIIAHAAEDNRLREEITSLTRRLAGQADRETDSALQAVIDARDRRIAEYGEEMASLLERIKRFTSDIAKLKELDAKKDTYLGDLRSTLARQSEQLNSMAKCAHCLKPPRKGHSSKPSYDTISIELPPSAYLKPPVLSTVPSTPTTTTALSTPLPPSPLEEPPAGPDTLHVPGMKEMFLVHGNSVHPDKQADRGNSTPPHARGPLSPPKQPVIFGVGSPSASGGHLDPGITSALRSQIAELEGRKRQLEERLNSLSTSDAVIQTEYKTAIDELEESLQMVRKMYGRAMHFNHEARVVKQKRRERRRSPRMRKQSTGSLRRLYSGSVRSLRGSMRGSVRSPSARLFPSVRSKKATTRVAVPDVRDVFQQNVKGEVGGVSSANIKDSPVVPASPPPRSYLPRSTSTLLRPRKPRITPSVDVFGESSKSGARGDASA